MRSLKLYLNFFEYNFMEIAETETVKNDFSDKIFKRPEIPPDTAAT